MTPEQIAAARLLLGLDATLTDEEVEARAAPLLTGIQAGEEGAEPAPPADDPGTTDDESGETEDEPAVAEPAGVASRADAGTVRVDQTMLAQLRADAQAGREARAIQLRADRERIVDAAIQQGRFAPSRRQHYLRSLEVDPEGTTALIDSLAEGLVPVNQRAVQPSETATSAGYPAEWLPDVQIRNRNIQAQATQGVRPRVMNDAA